MAVIENSLIDSFIEINKFFQKQKLRYCLIGGLAAGFWGEPRYTQDMDFTVVSRSADAKSLKSIFEKAHFKVETKGEDQLQVIQKGKLSFRADLILANTDYQDLVVARAKVVTLFDVPVPICTPEDLIILKIIANRRQDLVDIENVLKNHAATLDKKYLKEWFEFWEVEKRFRKEFGEILT